MSSERILWRPANYPVALVSTLAVNIGGNMHQLTRPSIFVLVVLSVLICLKAHADERDDSGMTAYVEGDRAAVIAFLPPSVQVSQDEGATEAEALIRLTLQNTKTCLAEDRTSYRVVFVQRIVVRSREGEEIFEVGDFAPLVGALLLRPHTNPRILFATGAEALAQMLQPAASEYFDRRCKAD
jgi:hypothetical protein